MKSSSPKALVCQRLNTVFNPEFIFSPQESLEEVWAVSQTLVSARSVVTGIRFCESCSARTLKKACGLGQR